LAELLLDVDLHHSQHRWLHSDLLVGESAEEENQEAEGRVKIRSFTYSGIGFSIEIFILTSERIISRQFLEQPQLWQPGRNTFSAPQYGNLENV
jgi:hypothetical protein